MDHISDIPPKRVKEKFNYNKNMLAEKSTFKINLNFISVK